MHSMVGKSVDNATTNNEQNAGELCVTKKSQEKDETILANIPVENGGNVTLNLNDRRRDSTQMWTPLLEKGNQNSVLNEANLKNINQSNDTVYVGEVSNNNDWNDDKLNANGLDNSLNHSNNNGSLINGKAAKAGAGLIDKCGEHAPLTGLYKEKPDSSSIYAENDKGLEQEGCGLFGCKPKWARGLASTHMFMVVFLLAYILQGMYMTYFVSVITTIEKLFQIKSRTTGFLLSASEVGQINTAMLLTYYAGRGHRPRWIACGMVLFSIAAFACALPHFIFGKELIHSTSFLSKNGLNNFSNDKMSFQPQELNSHNTSALMTTQHMDINLCHVGVYPQNSTVECNEDRKLEQVSHSKITVIALCIFFGSLLSTGIGQTAVSTLGIPYIDDNVASKQSAMYMAITIGVRILGPASGFIVGSVCTRWYVNFSNPGFDASDPRWIGAWWLGPVLIGSLMLLSSIAMFSFPKQLRGKKPQQGSSSESSVATKKLSTEPEETPRLKDFPKTVRRQLRNDILMFRTASCVFHLLPIAGLYTFLPKYLETQFRLAPYNANMVTAFCGILVMGIGIVASGLVIFKFKPTARAVAAWIALTALVYSAGMVILMFVGCDMYDFAGYKPPTRTSAALIEPECSVVLNCTCDREQFAPICGVNGKIYISSCHAGCSAADIRSVDNHTVFSQCSCIPDIYDGDKTDNNSYDAVSGYCDSNCKNFIIFIIIFVICVFMHSTSEVGSMLLIMRCTHPKDKAMAMGLIQSAIGLFGNVPCPVIYGAVVDSTCLIWRSVCGKHGACSLYDADTFRHYFLGITAVIMFLAFIMDLVVWKKAHRIDISPEENNENKSSDSGCQKQMKSPAVDTSV